MRSRLAAVAFAAVLTASAPAWADPHGEAVKAFEEGRRLRDASDFDKAVRAFERSLSLEPSIGAYYNLGLINEQLGRPREAVDAFRKAEKLAREKGDAREKDAVEGRTKVLETHNHVTLHVGEDVANAPGLRLVLDGEVVPPAQYDGEVFRAPASHELVVTAQGRKELRVQARNKQTLHVALGEAMSAALAPPVAETPSTSGWGWQKWTGVGLVGVGVAGMAISMIRLLDYASEESSLDTTRREAVAGCEGSGNRITTCDGSTTSPRVERANDALAAYNANEQDAKDGAPLTAAAGIAGLLLVGGGIALFVTAPPDTAAPAPSARLHLVPRIGPRDTALLLVGTF